MFALGLKENDIVKHDELCKRVGCGCMGGIRYSKENNVILLFINSKSQYDNDWDGNTLKFMGSGKGNQEIYKRDNKNLADSRKKFTSIYLFDNSDFPKCKYISKMRLVGEPYTEVRKNKSGVDETKVFFMLEKTQE